MNRVKNIIFGSCILFTTLLVFLLFFESKIQIPPYLQVIGRTHPLILHFPIVFLVIFLFWIFGFETRIEHNNFTKSIGNWLLLITLFFSITTSFIGFLLSKEEGYEGNGLAFHKWYALGLTCILWLWYLLFVKLNSTKNVLYFLGISSLILVTLTGHEGANLTHGDGFITAPLHSKHNKIKPIFDSAYVYEDMVRPIFEEKCNICHNTNKAKGELILESQEMILKGGKNGKLWDNHSNKSGLMMQRLNLAVDHKEHMPPTGKPQLTFDEKRILYLWVKQGANFKIKVSLLPSNDSLRMIASRMFSKEIEEIYDFAAAGEADIKKLNNDYRKITPIFANSPALSLEIYGASTYKPELLKDALKLKEQIVRMNLNKLPIQNNELKTIASFTNLRNLNLSFTKISELDELLALKDLKEISLSGTPVNLQNVQKLVQLPKLKNVFLWNSKLSDEDFRVLSKNSKNIKFFNGYKNDTTLLKLTPPIFLNEEQMINKPTQLLMKHYVNDLEMRYTQDGSAPDSIHSAIYKPNIMIQKTAVVKAKAFKKGWLSSDVSEYNFFSATIKADSAYHILPADKAYLGSGPKSLIDFEKGDISNFKVGKRWLGYRDNSMVSMIVFSKPKMFSGLNISCAVNVSSYIMPPTEIEVWGGNSTSQLKLLNKIKPEASVKLDDKFSKLYNIKINKSEYKFIKLIVKPLGKLPAWHPGKGQKGWVFVDEVFFE